MVAFGIPLAVHDHLRRVHMIKKNQKGFTLRGPDLRDHFEGP